jgi:hypothetical protein
MTKVKNKNLGMVQHVWCQADDRWVSIERDFDDKIVGLNWMQGNDYEKFKKNWEIGDERLTAFYREMLYTFPIEQQGTSELAFINKVMWAYFSAQPEAKSYYNVQSIKCFSDAPIGSSIVIIPEAFAEGALMFSRNKAYKVLDFQPVSKRLIIEDDTPTAHRVSEAFLIANFRVIK